MANEFLDLLTFYVAEHGLEKLEFNKFALLSKETIYVDRDNAHFDEEVLTRLANMCPRITTLIFSEMDRLGHKSRV